MTDRQQPTTQELFSHIDKTEPIVTSATSAAVAAPTFSNATRASSRRTRADGN